MQEDGTFTHHEENDDLNCLDVLTLIRHSIVATIVYECEYTCDLVFSHDYKDIYLLIAPDSEDLMKQ